MIIDKRIKSRLVFPEPATCTPTPTSARTTHAASWAKKGSTYVNTFTHGADMKDRETGQTQVPSSRLHQDPLLIYALFTLALSRNVDSGHKAPAKGDTDTLTFLPTAREIPANSTHAAISSTSLWLEDRRGKFPLWRNQTRKEGREEARKISKRSAEQKKIEKKMRRKT